MNVIRFYDLFRGVGGFRLGLERANASETVPFIPRGQEDGPASGNINGDRRVVLSEGLRELRGPGGGPDGQEATIHGGASEAPPRGDTPSHRDRPVFRCVGSCDIDGPATKVYDRNFKERHEPADARLLDARSLPDFELLCAGFPCQSFSMAGKRRGFQDARGTLFFEIARIAEVKRPRLLLLENVKGLLSHDEGRTFLTILSVLDELGYDCEWEVLNSKHFGVPQNRERVFVVGHLRGEPFREVFPLGQGLEVAAGTQKREGGGNQITRTLSSPGHAGGNHTDMNLIFDDFNNSFTEDFGVVRPTFGNEGGGNGVKIVLGNLYENEGENGQVIDPSGIAGALKSGETDNPESGGIGSSNSPKIPFGSRIRRLTPVECERLQGFPELESLITAEVKGDIVCFDLPESYVNVAIRNRKSPRCAGIVANDRSKLTASSVAFDSQPSGQNGKEPAPLLAHIDCGESQTEISLRRPSSSAGTAGAERWSLLSTQAGDFAHLVVGLNTILGRIIGVGRAGSHQNVPSSTLPENGRLCVELSGKETARPAKDATGVSTTNRPPFTSIMSGRLPSEKRDSSLRTLFSSALDAIDGFIPRETIKSSGLWLEIHSSFGWTAGVSDTQRYKMMGNAVTVNVIQAIGEKILAVEGAPA